MKRYTIAVRRQHRTDGSVARLESVLREIDGVRVLGVSGAHAQIEAPEPACDEVRRRLGDAYIVEELIGRRPV